VNDHAIEVAAGSMGHSRARPHPQRTVRRLIQALYAAAGQSIGEAEWMECLAVVPEQPVLRAYPDKSRAVLRKALDGEVSQSLVLAISLEAVALRRAWQHGEHGEN
jgi:hypothetical protein